MLVRHNAMRCDAQPMRCTTRRLSDAMDWTEAVCVCCVSQQIQVQDPHSSAGIVTAAAMHLTRMDRNVKMRGRPFWLCRLDWTGLD